MWKVLEKLIGQVYVQLSPNNVDGIRKLKKKDFVADLIRGERLPEIMSLLIVFRIRLM